MAKKADIEIKKTEEPAKPPIKVTDTMQALAIVLLLAYMIFIALKHNYII